jgi:hypothetical protein
LEDDGDDCTALVDRIVPFPTTAPYAAMGLVALSTSEQAFLLTNNPTTIREAERKLHLQTYGPVADLCNLPISGQHDGKSKDDC